MKRFKIKATALFIAALLGINASVPAYAAVGDQGVDWSIYQGYNGKFGYASDKFAIIQAGGYAGYGVYNQPTYTSQVHSALSHGLRAHTYLWWENVYSTAQADRVLDYFLPRVQTPKGSIIALDAEGGYQNTAILQHALRRIRSAGYTPVLYGYKAFLTSHVDLHALAAEFPLWLGEYPDNNITTRPNYSFFPSFENVQLFQFTSTYTWGGLDASIDLSGITDNGYVKQPGSTPAQAPKPVVPAAPALPATKTYTVRYGDTLSQIAASYGATTKALQTLNGLANPNMIYVGQTLRIAGSAVTKAPTPASKTYTVRYGDTLGQIAASNGTTTQALQALNGLANANVIYAGQTLRISGSLVASAPARATKTYTVRYGDTLGQIAANNGTTTQALQALNGLSNPNMIYAGQTLRIAGSAISAQPRATKTYTVRYGDTLGQIAASNGTTTRALQSLNGLANANVIYAGQTLRIK